MIRITKTIGRLIAVLVDSGVITGRQAELILEPLKDKAESEEKRMKNVKLIIDMPEKSYTAIKELDFCRYISVPAETDDASKDNKNVSAIVDLMIAVKRAKNRIKGD